MEARGGDLQGALGLGLALDVPEVQRLHRFRGLLGPGLGQGLLALEEGHGFLEASRPVDLHPLHQGRLLGALQGQEELLPLGQGPQGQVHRPGNGPQAPV